MAALKKPKQEAFAVAFTEIGANTFGNGEKSAVAAKYSEDSARTQAWRLLKNDGVNARILELYDENLKDNRVTAQSVLANLAHDRFMARKTGQYSVAVRCDELEGKYLSMFTDRLATVDLSKEAKAYARMSEEDREFARKSANDRLDEIASGQTIPFGSEAN